MSDEENKYNQNDKHGLSDYQQNFMIFLALNPNLRMLIHIYTHTTICAAEWSKPEFSNFHFLLFNRIKLCSPLEVHYGFKRPVP